MLPTNANQLSSDLKFSEGASVDKGLGKTVGQLVKAFCAALVALPVVAQAVGETHTLDTATTLTITAASTDYEGDNFILSHSGAQLIIQGSHALNSVTLNLGKVVQEGDVTVAQITSSAGNVSSEWDQSTYALTVTSDFSLKKGTIKTQSKPSFPTADLLVDDYVYSMGAPQTWGDVTVQSSGKITSGEGVVLDLQAQNILIKSGSSIDVSEKGVRNRYLDINDPSPAHAKVGGSLAGRGGGFSGAESGSIQVDDIYAPSLFGEGGIDENGGSTGLGGGVVHIQAVNLELQSNGAIRADGVAYGGPVYTYRGSGSGGSIWLDISGEIVLSSASSVISANGGGNFAANPSYAGGGSGGRIAVSYGTLSPGNVPLERVLEVHGGQLGDDGQSGEALVTDGAGYIALYYTSRVRSFDQGSPVQVAPVVGIDEYFLINVPANISGDFSGSSIRVRESEVHQTGQVTAAQLRETGYVSGTPGSWYQDGHALNLASDIIWRDMSLWSDAPVVFSGANDDLLIDDWTLVAMQPQVWGDVTVQNLGKITAAQGTVLDLEAQNIVVSGTGSIDVSAKGIRNRYLDVSDPNSAYASVGGSHGGAGGGAGGASAGAVYGDIYHPNSFGEGGLTATGASSCPGGGVAQITAGSLVLQSGGDILANGTLATGCVNGGGPAGGSIEIEAGNLEIASTSSLIQAKGYGTAGASSFGGGGGGRIAVYYGQLTNTTEAEVLASLNVTGGGGVADGVDGTAHVAQITFPVTATGIVEGTLYASAINNVSVSFSEAIDIASFSASDVEISTGTISAVSQLDATTVALTFSSALPDGQHTLSLGGEGVDMIGDGITSVSGQPVQRWDVTVTVDTQPPPTPVVTQYAGIPAEYYVNASTVSLSGTRDADAAIHINGAVKASAGTQAWSVSGLPLSPSNPNDLVITAVDAVGNVSAPVTVRFIRDSNPPVLQGMTPTGATNQVPASLQVAFSETETMLDMAQSSAVLTRSGVNVPGSFANQAGQLVFTPASALIQGSYSLAVTIKDKAGNTASTSYGLTIDTTPPAAPTLTSPPDNSTSAQVTLSGSKEGNTSVHAQGVEVVALDALTSWSYDQTLEPGQNQIQLTAVDAAGNISAVTSHYIWYDDVPPGAVNASVDPQWASSGTDLNLIWTYDSQANGGDIAFFKVYVLNTMQDPSALDPASAPSSDPIEAIGGTVNYDFLVTGLSRVQPSRLGVLAFDTRGNYSSPSATSWIDVTPVDVMAPENVTGLVVTPALDSLQLDWTASADSDGDLAGYRIYQGSTQVTELSPATLTYTLTGLSSDTRYDVSVRSIDGQSPANESSGAANPGVTLLTNPTILTTSPLSGRVELTWSPAAWVQSYNIYAEPSTAYTSVAGKTVRLNVNGATTAATLAGLENGTEYHLAVTAVNLSGGENPTIGASVAETPIADTDGPLMSNFKYGADTLVGGLQLSSNASITLTAEDESGISSIAFKLVDAVPETRVLGTDYAAPYLHSVNLATIDDGSYTLIIEAKDSLGNSTTASFPVTVSLNPPAAPTISKPTANALVNTEEVAVSGATAANTEVTLYVGAVAQGAPIEVGATGQYSGTVTLQPGANQIGVTSRFVGRSTDSTMTTRDVTLDLTVPKSPSALTATAKAGGDISLRWSTPVEPAAGYHVYRAASSFDEVSAATRLTTAPITTQTQYLDSPDTDGVYYYRVVAVNLAGTESEPTNLAQAASDDTPPQLVSAEFSSAAAFGIDPLTLIPGVYQVDVEYSEPLLIKPYLAVAPADGVALVVNLSAVAGSTTEYRGSFEVTALTPSGTARLVSSALDKVSNHGDEVLEHATFAIDAQGPEVTGITLLPASPIDNNPPAEGVNSVTVIVETSELSTQMPKLVPQIDATPIAAYIDGLPLQAEQATGAGERWSASFDLPVDAGTNTSGNPATQLLSFAWEALDTWGNTGTKVRVSQNFQVYQGDLPPLATPQNLTGTAIGGGAIALSWEQVSGASGYRLYRAPSGSSLQEVRDITGETTLTFVDDGDDGFANAAGTGLVDGEYLYAVASLRTANTETAASGQSNVVTVNADSVAPVAPTNLVASLTGSGVYLDWDYAGPPEQDLTFRVYRQASAVTSLEELGTTPLLENLVSTLYLDKQPADDARHYVVVAVDGAGNLSAPSNDVYINDDLLPVRDLLVSLEQGGDVQVSWKYDLANAEGFNLSATANSVTTLLNGDGLIVSGSNPVTYIDDKVSLTSGGFAARDRLYSVEAIDDVGVASLAREVTLPAISLDMNITDDNGIAEPQSLKVGVFNQIKVNVHNRGTQSISNASLDVAFDQYEDEQWVTRHYPSESFDLAPGEKRTVPVVVGGVSNPLTTSADLTVTFEDFADTGEEVNLVTHANLPVIDAAYVAELKVDSLVTDAQGEVRIVLENTTELPIEMVTATASGTQPSSDVRILVQDLNGNTLTVNTVKIATGDVVTKVNGNTVAEVPPGERYVSAPVTLSMLNVQDEAVRLVLIIDKLYYQYAEPTQISTAGLVANLEASTSVPPYAAANVAVTPGAADLFGVSTADITITGNALLDDGSTTVPNAPLQLVLGINGYERRFDLTTDANGDFTYVFSPSVSEAGLYAVSVVYPGSSTRPEQASFEVRGATLVPTQINATWPRNYANAFQVKVTSKASTALQAVTIQEPVLPDGITLTLPQPVNVEPGKTVTLEVGFAADASADDNGVFALPVVIDGGATSLGNVVVNYSLTEAKPVLFTSPPYLETGVVKDTGLLEEMSVTNSGYDTALGVTANLIRVDENGNTLATPTWARILAGAGTPGPSGMVLGDLAPGDTLPITLSFDPDSTVGSATYLFKIQLSGDNAPLPTQLPTVAVHVVDQGVGSVVVQIEDIYTGTDSGDDDAQGNPILITGVEGATVKLQHADVLTYTYTLTSDANGNAIFEDLPPGRYYYHATAPGHDAKGGSLWIRPDVTTAQRVFLMNQLVSVSWSVEEITLQDRYHVVLTATYQTKVPVAVLALEPMTVKLPDMKQGEVFRGELRLTNYGLIASYDIRQTLPVNNEWFQVEFLREPPEVMEAGQVVTLPYRITALRNLDGSTDSYASGGGCFGPPPIQTTVRGECECVNGAIVPTYAGASWSPPTTTRDCSSEHAPVIYVLSDTGSVGNGDGWYKGGYAAPMLNGSGGVNDCMSDGGGPGCDDKNAK